MNTKMAGIIFMLAFMLADVVTGLVGAIKNKSYESRKMREGLWHKLGYVLAVAFCALVEAGCRYAGLGIALPLLEPVALYITLNEIGSVLENIDRIAPDALPKKIRDVLGDAVKNGGIQEKKEDEDEDS